MALDTLTHDPWWHPCTVPATGCCQWQLGRSSLWVRRLGSDLALAMRTDEEELPYALVGTLAAIPEGIPDWPRWIIAAPEPRLRVMPTLPATPVVIRPAQAVTVAPRLSARIYVGIPCDLRLELITDEDGLTLHEQPSVPLSQTWFGETSAGELALSVRSRARRLIEDIDHWPHRILCPVEINNQHSEPFRFERAFVRLAYSGIYHGAERLWASAIHLTYRGPEHEVEMEAENHPPREAATAALLQAARISGGTKGGRSILPGLRGSWMH